MATEVQVAPKEDQKIVQRILQIGLGLAVSLMVGGIVAQLALDPDLPAAALSLEGLVDPDAGLPARLLGWGVFVLALTPVVRVVSLIVLWVRMKDWLYAAVSITVLLTLALAVAVGHR